jgi:DivIVA domain-containing protein
MDTKTNAPSFTVSLRGYDREEVDEYLDSLAEALGQVEEAEAHSRRLQAHVAKCNARIKELEDRIRADTPKSGIALGERIGVLLNEAEDAASDIMTRAEAESARIVAVAQARATEAEELMRSSTVRAEEQARRIETVARGEAAEIVAEAEARATARTRQIEQWAEQVVSHTRAEEARQVLEQQRAKETAMAEMKGLTDQRDSAVANLTALREALGRAVGLVEDAPASAGGNGTAAPNGVGTAAPTSTPMGGIGVPDAAISPTAGPASPAEGVANDVTDSDDVTPVTPIVEDDQFEAKLDAWVAGPADEN